MTTRRGQMLSTRADKPANGEPGARRAHGQATRGPGAIVRQAGARVESLAGGRVRFLD